MKLLTSLALERKIDVVLTRVDRLKRMIFTIKHDNKILLKKKKAKLRLWEANKVGRLTAELIILNNKLRDKEAKLREMMKIKPDKLSIGHIDGFRHLK